MASFLILLVLLCRILYHLFFLDVLVIIKAKVGKLWVYPDALVPFFAGRLCYLRLIGLYLIYGAHAFEQFALASLLMLCFHLTVFTLPFGVLRTCYVLIHTV